jgi:predicted nucleotidyltransferase
VAVTGHMDVFAAHPTEMEKFHFDPTCTYKLYHQSGVQVDLWKHQHADRIVANSHPIELAGRKIQMVDLLDLICMKLRAHRLKDDYDISQIIQTNEIDQERLRSLVKPDEFAWFLEIKKRTSAEG